MDQQQVLNATAQMQARMGGARLVEQRRDIAETEHVGGAGRGGAPRGRGARTAIDGGENLPRTGRGRGRGRGGKRRWKWRE